MEPLKKLKLTTTEVIKNKHFANIEARLSKDAPPKPAILPNIIGVAIVLIMMILIISPPTTTVTTSSELTKIYINDLGGPSHSKWFVGVKETTNERHLQAMSTILLDMQPVEAPTTVQDISNYFTVFYADGTSKTYATLTVFDWLWDIETNAYYQYEEDELANMKLSHIIWDTTYADQPIWQLVALLSYIILKLIIHTRYYPRDVDGRKLPRHSTPMQSVLSLLPIIIVFTMLLLPHFFHYGIIVVVISIIIFLLIWLETKHDNATWRKWMFLDMYWIVIWTYIIFSL